MKDFDVCVRIGLKEGILDPQAEAIQAALQRLEFSGVKDFKLRKEFVLKLEAESEAEALERGRAMASKLLANLVMENYEVELLG